MRLANPQRTVSSHVQLQAILSETCSGFSGRLLSLLLALKHEGMNSIGALRYVRSHSDAAFLQIRTSRQLTPKLACLYSCGRL